MNGRSDERTFSASPASTRASVCAAANAPARVRPIDEMEYHPHQFVSMVENGRIDELMASKGIYTCLSCFACVERCPRNVEPAKLIEAVRLAVIRQQGDEPSARRSKSRSCWTTSCRSRPSPAHSGNTESKEGTNDAENRRICLSLRHEHRRDGRRRSGSRRPSGMSPALSSPPIIPICARRPART